MLLINQSTIVYILCSSNAVTGGPEALHQLCDKINSNGGRAKMIYVDYGSQEFDPEAKTHIRYRHYKVAVAKKIEDE